MSAVVERVGEPRVRRLAGVARVERDAGFVATRVVLTALYAGYVVVQLPGLLVPLAAMLCGLAAVLVFDAPRRAAWCATASVVIAVLHARVVPGDARWLAIQLGLAAFVVTSATLSLVVVGEGRRGRLAPVLALAVGLGCLVGVPAGAASGAAAAIGGLLAGMRPLSALEVVVLGRTNDRWLAWTPVLHKGGR